MDETGITFFSILDDVDRRIPSVPVQKAKLDEALSCRGDWRTIEDGQRLQFRLSQLSMSREAAQLIEAESPVDLEFNVLERIVNANELMPVSFLYKGAQAAKTVGRVNIKTTSGIAGYGTGFMISPNLMLTNHHVLENSESARHSLLEMNYRETAEGFSDSSFFRILPDQFFEASADLDFALVAVESVNEEGDRLEEYGFNRIIKESGKALVGEHVNIIQHPSAEPKQVALRNNKIIGKVDNFLHYITDTQQGSSGSPVFNDNWELVALHHAGKPARDSDGNVLLVDGSVWDGSFSGQSHIRWEANEGVRISQIFNYLDSIVSQMDAGKRTLYRNIFNVSSIGQLDEKSGRAQLDCQRVRSEDDGSTSIYLKVNVKNSNEAIGYSSVNSQAKKIVSDSGFSSEKYYDAGSDESERDDYYDEINLDQDKDTVFKDLSHLLKETHKGVLSYRSARLDYLYPLVDRREYSKLKSIYSGTLLDPEEIIARDLKILAEHHQEFISLDSLEVYSTESEKDEAVDLFEASLNFNCEHVVPQSWFEKRSPMRSDLHHLFTCESGCNSFRSNIPYWQFAPLDEALRSSCGRREGDKFEPENGYGAVSRATLYFLLRYPGELGNSHGEMPIDRLEILINWHKRYPVSLYELHRNASIFKIQGNRNPLIDYPQLVDKINFNIGFH